jgi:hypothetical protein
MLTVQSVRSRAGTAGTGHSWSHAGGAAPHQLGPCSFCFRARARSLGPAPASCEARKPASTTVVVRDLVTFGTTAINARSEEDLGRAARYFPSAVVAAGVTVVFAILLRRSAAKLQSIPRAEHRPGDDASATRIGRGRTGAARRGARRTPTVTGDPTMPAGQGATNASERGPRKGRLAV